MEHYYGDSAPRQILLVKEIRIYRHEHVKFGLCGGQEFSVLSPCPASVLNCQTFMTLFIGKGL